MSKFPFIPIGVDDKRKELYALSDSALAVEAIAIKVSFRNWVRTNFELNTDQLAYLNGTSDKITEYSLVSNVWFYFLYSLPIELEMSTTPPMPNYAKWTGSRNKIKAKSDGNVNQDVSRSLTFVI